VNYSHLNELIEETEQERKWARHWNMIDVCEQESEERIHFITEDLNVNIPEVSKENCKCNIYPNPTNEKIILSFNSLIDNFIHISLFYFTGSLLTEYFISENFTSKYEMRIDMGTFPSGIYFLHIRSGDYIYIEKIIKFNPGYNKQ
jgi:hypothetical protein